MDGMAVGTKITARRLAALAVFAASAVSAQPSGSATALLGVGATVVRPLEIGHAIDSNGDGRVRTSEPGLATISASVTGSVEPDGSWLFARSDRGETIVVMIQY